VHRNEEIRNAIVYALYTAGNRSIAGDWYATRMKSASKNRQSAREIAYLHIQKKIATRALSAGMPVSELPIAKELGISRTPTREAIRQHVAEGLLEQIPGRGVVVVKLERRDIAEIYEIRKALEVHAARAAALRFRETADLRGLRQVADRVQSLIQELRRSGHERLNADQMKRLEAAGIGFHTLLLQAAGNRRILKLVTGLRSLVRSFAMHRKGYAADQLKRIHQDHCDVIAAIQARDPDRAAAVMQAHMEGSQRERLEQFDQREQEAGLPRDISAFLEKIQAELS
jgi:DNA-binding GntR family transcriptional regulator